MIYKKNSLLLRRKQRDQEKTVLVNYGKHWLSQPHVAFILAQMTQEEIQGILAGTMRITVFPDDGVSFIDSGVDEVPDSAPPPSELPKPIHLPPRKDAYRGIPFTDSGVDEVPD